jgi:DNA repair protein RadC
MDSMIYPSDPPPLGEPEAREERANEPSARILRPREKLLRFGARGLSHAELIAILLGSGIRGRSVLRVA